MGRPGVDTVSSGKIHAGYKEIWVRYRANAEVAPAAKELWEMQKDV
jgi:hypothetical protein